MQPCPEFYGSDARRTPAAAPQLLTRLCRTRVDQRAQAARASRARLPRGNARGSVASHRARFSCAKNPSRTATSSELAAPYLAPRFPLLPGRFYVAELKRAGSNRNGVSVRRPAELAQKDVRAEQFAPQPGAEPRSFVDTPRHAESTTGDQVAAECGRTRIPRHLSQRRSSAAVTGSSLCPVARCGAPEGR